MKTIQVCEICNREDCDGIVYETISEHPSCRGSKEMIKFTMCKNKEAFRFINGKPFYRQVFGHGDTTYYTAKKKEN